MSRETSSRRGPKQRTPCPRRGMLSRSRICLTILAEEAPWVRRTEHQLPLYPVGDKEVPESAGQDQETFIWPAAPGRRVNLRAGPTSFLPWPADLCGLPSPASSPFSLPL